MASCHLCVIAKIVNELSSSEANCMYVKNICVKQFLHYCLELRYFYRKISDNVKFTGVRSQIEASRVPSLSVQF